MSEAGPSSGRRPVLIVRGGADDGRVLAVETRDQLLGSHPDCRLQVSGAGVSPVHARLVLGVHGLLVSDAGSAAGTYVNDQRLTQARILRDDDQVSLGPPDSQDGQELRFEENVPLLRSLFSFLLYFGLFSYCTASAN